MTGANSQLQTALGDYPTVSGNTTRGITPDSLALACIAAETATGGVPTVQKGWCQGAQARLKRANDGKEVPQKLNLVLTSDSGSDAQKTDTDLTDAIANKKVFSVLLVASAPLASNPMETQHVPYFGDFIECGTKSVFGFDVGYNILTCSALYAESKAKWTTYSDSIMQTYVKPKGTTIDKIKYAAVGTNIPAIATYLNALVGQFKAQGVQVVYSGTPLPASSGEAIDLNPYVVPVVNAKPDIVGLFSPDPQLTARYYGALKDGGYKGDVLASFTSSQLANPATAQLVDGGLATSVGFGFSVYGGPSWDTINQDATAAGAPVPVTQAFFRGWVAADQLVTGLKDFAKTGQPLTTENFTNFLNHGWQWPGVGNVAAPTIYPFGKYSSAPCTAMARENAAQKKEVPYQDLSCGKVFFQQL
ncbi:MAG TPA: ABC transporter substrate-binding protein [Acidimicrobiales bacterium]|nr:ABC transporter substrate-binding protein [Acidimicrobiales bacterium]